MSEDLHRLSYTTQEVQDILDAVADKYEKPSGGIPSTDLASGVQTSLGKADTAYQKPGSGIPSSDMTSAVQTSLGKADTALQSFTETDPVFSASAAAGIDSDDITNWNGKTSNIGTITSVKMNGNTVSSSGEADLGTVITSHQDISGKADDNAVVHNTGNETVAGDKSFSGHVAINGSIGTSNDDDYPTGFGWLLDYNDVPLQNVLDGKVSSVVQGGTTYSPVYGVVTLPALPFGTYIGTGTNWGSTATTCYLRTSYFSGGIVPQKEGDLVYSTGTRNLHRCGAVTWDSVQECYKTTPTFVCYVSGFAGAFSNLSNTPTTLSGYGITDAKIENGTITLGSNTITPITSHQSLAGYWNNTNSGTTSYQWDASLLTLANNGSIRFKDSGGTERVMMRFNSGNKLIIGDALTASPSNGDLLVYGVTHGFYTADLGGSLALRMLINSSGNVTMGASDLASTSYKLYVSGDIYTTGTITPGSDSRIKNNQEEITAGQAFGVIDNLVPKSWTWNEDAGENLVGKKAAGLVAQEVKEVLPEAVNISKNDKFDDFHALNYNTIQGYEIAAIRGLIEENKALKSEVAELKEKLDAIMEMLK